MVVTFVISSDLNKSAAILDDKILNKQILECDLILNSLLLGKVTNQPSFNMWLGYEDALVIYRNAMLREWIQRGKNSTREFLEEEEDVVWPWWWGWKKLMLSHRLSLYRKDPQHYASLIREHEKKYLATIGYIWPYKLFEEFYGDIEKIKSLHLERLASPLGKGVPAQYRWSIEDVEKWLQNKNKNPRTGRNISSASKTGVYSDLEKAYTYYLTNNLL